MNKNNPMIPCSCFLCQKSRLFEISNPKIKTTQLCILILKSLKNLYPELECFSIKLHINDFIKNHWSLLEKLKIFQSNQWKKSILDALNHCPSIECGKDFCHDRGYYRLKENIKGSKTDFIDENEKSEKHHKKLGKNYEKNYDKIENI